MASETPTAETKARLRDEHLLETFPEDAPPNIIELSPEEIEAMRAHITARAAATRDKP